MMKIPLAKPHIEEDDINAIVEVMKSGILSIGPRIEEFEKRIAEYVGVKHAIAVNSGTSGLHLIVKALDIKDGDEVITTPFSFIASSNCILFERAKPVFVDIDPKTLNIDIFKIEEKITDKTKAILVVDVFGHPNDMKKINDIAKKHNLKVIEDSCEALGSFYQNISTGKSSDAGVFAFYPNKQITTAEGGVIVTNNDEIAELCRSMRSQGRAITGTWLNHERLGYNYRMSELHAALGVAQMNKLDKIISKRQEVATLYNEFLKGVEGIELPYVAKEVTQMSWFVYVVKLSKDLNRDKAIEILASKGVGCKPYFTPIHEQDFYKDIVHESFPIAEDIGRRSIAIPFYTDLKESEIYFVVEKVKETIKELRGF